MKRQWTGWGYIDWLEETMDENSAALNVGIVSISPHAHMNPHIHFTEQVLYTLQGTGYSLVNGQKIDMSQPGVILHWEASVIHEMYNMGETEFKHLMVSCPDTVEFDTPDLTNTDNQKMSDEMAEEYLHAAINGTCEQFLDTLHYSYVIFNAMGSPVKRTHIFPEFCCHHCLEKISSNRAACMCRYIACPFTEESSFECPHGVTVFYVPIIFHGVFLGYVQGGYVHMHSVPQEHVYVMPQSSIRGAKILLGRIVKAMVDYCEVYQFKNQLIQQELALADTRQYHEVLIADLRNAENTMTDLKINNHFLFNTLNQMASMALAGGMVTLYQSILDLSCLFSFAVRNNSSTVLLSKEFEYLDSYIKLQKLRYGERLQITYAIETDMNIWEVPFNFLMPLAENAFTHGFFQEDDKHFFLGIQEKDNVLLFTMENNGVIVDESSCQRIMQEMKGGAAHGLSMIYRKLQAACTEKFSITLSPGKSNGLRVVITLPARKMS